MSVEQINKKPIEEINRGQIIAPSQSEIWTPTEQREIESFIASIEFDLSEDDEFALKVKNEDPNQHELIMRIATGEMVPDRFCKFDVSSLENFAKDAAKGVPLMQSHNTYRDIGIGYTFLGEYVASKKYVNAAAYIIKGLKLNSGYTYSETDDYILALQKKGIREVSMGISGGTAICSICGGNYMSYRECQHWGGKEYPVGAERVMKLCFYTWHDSHLDEVSFVANGAVPGNAILKAQYMLQKGEIELQDISKIYEKRYKTLNVTETFLNKRIPYNIINSGDAETMKTEEHSSEPTTEKEENSEMDLTATITSLQTAHPNLNIPDDPAEALNMLATGFSASKATVETQQTQLKTLQDENAKLQLAARDGETYRQEWRKAAEDAHVARFGQPLAEVYVSLFDNESTPASEIRKYAETWQNDLQSANEGTQTNSGGQPKAKTIEGNQQGQGATAVILPRRQPLR